MKTYCVNEKETSPVYQALLQTIGLWDEHPEEKMLEPVQSLDEAELVFVIGRRSILNDCYSKDKAFILFLFNEHDRKQHLASDAPKNVLMGGMNLLENIETIKTAHALVCAQREKKTVAPAEAVSVDLPSDHVVTEGSYRVLVIDDTAENLELARMLLGGKHYVVAAQGFDRGMGALHDLKEFDAVLSDMQMPDNKHYGAFNMDVAKIGGTNPWGWFVVFEATAKGVPVAIVTDGNHHTDWVSAGFDYLKSANVNGQRVLFFNHIGKRWDKALKALLEP